MWGLNVCFRKGITRGFPHQNFSSGVFHAIQNDYRTFSH